MAVTKTATRRIYRDAAGFARAIRREYRVKLPRLIKEVQVELVSKVYDNVLISTPVLTGRARVSWMLTEGEPGTGMVDPGQEIQTPGHWIAATGQPLTGDEKAALTSVSAIIRSQKVGATVYLQNNQPYIEALEDGYSRMKAPFGMVKITLDWVGGQVQRQRIMEEARSRVK